MAIVLVATLLVLFAAHGVPALAQWRDFTWLRRWQEQVGSQGGDVLGLVLCLGGPVLACALIQVALRGTWLGLASLAFAIIVLFYCWGPRDLERDVEAIDKAPDSDRRNAALQALRVDPAQPALAFAADAMVEATFLAALRRWFGVLFWFVLLGPAGALLYRLTQVLAAMPDPASTRSAAQRALIERGARILDWLPAHLMTLALALASNFDAVFKAWRDYHAAHGKGFFCLDLGFLNAVARACVDADIAAEEDEAAQAARTPLVALDDAMVLVRRVLVVWVTVIALIVLGGWFA
ncbi:MAG TPA: cobalamin biosynthesis protein [Rudaea sp.]|nr:cobalamin biosynthesis protein [Rudaea sp.]